LQRAPQILRETAGGTVAARGVFLERIEHHGLEEAIQLGGEASRWRGLFVAQTRDDFRV
jgi:hypothetical protein